MHLFLSHHVTPKVFLEVHAALQCHAEVAALVVGVEELFRRIDLVHVLPAAAVEGLQESREADVAEDAVPRHGELQVAHGAVGGASRMLLMRQQDRLGDRHAQLVAQREVEELVVGAPPERVVDDVGARERGVLQVAAIERNVVGDAIDDDVVGRGLGHANFADRGEFGLNAGLVHGVDLVDQRGGNVVSIPKMMPIFFTTAPWATTATEPRLVSRCMTLWKYPGKSALGALKVTSIVGESGGI